MKSYYFPARSEMCSLRAKAYVYTPHTGFIGLHAWGDVMGFCNLLTTATTRVGWLGCTGWRTRVRYISRGGTPVFRGPILGSVPIDLSHSPTAPALFQCIA